MIKLSCRTEDLQIAAKMIKEGAVISYPTDTVYGIGCDPLNEESVKRIIKIKNRENKPMPILCYNIEMIKKIIFLSKKELNIITKFWPGPLTVIGKCIKPEEFKQINLNSDKLGVRIPNNHCSRELIKLCGGYLIGTSANKSGQKSAVNYHEVVKQLGDEVDAIIDFGTTELQIDSTVIDITDNKIRIIREGNIKKSDLKI
tara:strand:- start:31 stop:633 length:603 start_codon:yes stop_codon:yes gene_type:complete